MKPLITTALFLSSILVCIGQTPQSIEITKQDAQALFLEKNLELLTHKLEISQAQAQQLQAKVWPNPTFSISDVNLWKNSTVEQQPALINQWGTTTQFSLQVEQLIQTAGKRRKLMATKELAVAEKQIEFQILLRQLKLELRNTLTDLQFNQALQDLYSSQIESMQRLLHSYESQLNKGTISQGDFIRLKAAFMSFKKELTQIQSNYNTTLAQTKVLLGLPSDIDLTIIDPLTIPSREISSLELQTLISQVPEHLPEALLYKNKSLSATKELDLEKAARFPDLVASVSFDRAGNIMRNFIGVGLSFDLPVFNTNKGAIKEARLEIEKQQVSYQNTVIQNSNDIQNAYQNFKNTQELYLTIDPTYEETLDHLVASYDQNFLNKNVSLITYLDFVEAYLENKTLILDTKKDLIDQFELLQFTLAQEL